MSYLGSILGPVIIGLTAEWTSLRLALGIPAVLALAIAAAARFVEPAVPPPSTRRNGGTTPYP